jgi:hypothetical protein
MSRQLEILAEFDICTHYLCAIFNDDYSGLDDTDEMLVKDWLSQNIPASSTLDFNEDSEAFKRDEITGLMAQCERVQVWGYLQ